MNCANTIYLKRICFCFSKIKGNVLWKRTSCLDTQSLKPINNSYLDVRIISDGCRRFSQDVTKGFGRSLSYPINNNGQNTNITPFAPYGLPSTILQCSLLPVDSFKYFMNVKDVIRGGGYNYCSIRYNSTNGRCSNNKNIGAKQTSSSSSEALKHSLAEGEEKLGLFQKFKKMFRDYWYVLIPVHCATYAVWFTGFYYMAESGVDIASVLQYFHVNESLIEPFKKGHFEKAGYFAVAFALCKLAAPLRYAVTVGLTTVSIKYLKLWGYIKPMPKKEQLKVMYKERKDIILEKKQQLQDNIFQRIKDIEDGKRKFHSKQKPPEST